MSTIMDADPERPWGDVDSGIPGQVVSLQHMPVAQVSAMILLGLATGLASGVLGIGGGVILVPGLVYLMGYSQHVAQGTTLALLCLPVGVAAAISYHREGLVHWNVALLLFCGFVLGSFFGSRFALVMPEIWLKRLFGGCLLALGTRMLLSR